MVNFVMPKGRGFSKAAVERLAEDIARILDFKPGSSLESTVSKIGGKIVFGTSSKEDFESGSIVARSLKDFTIYISNYTSLKRDRFTIAHELGHLFLHLKAIQDVDKNAVMKATRWVDSSDALQMRAEWEANWFAAAFLMPKDLFVKEFERGSLSAVQDKFDVSAKAAEIRAASLGLS